MSKTPFRNDLTAERVRELLHYDAFRGLFYWKKNHGMRARAGKLAGGLNTHDRVIIGIDGGRYQASRLAWLWMTGEWPSDEIDHRNTFGWDDRWVNLREATDKDQAGNKAMYKNNTSGFKGVTGRDGKWRAQIGINGRRTPLGTFPTKEEAAAAYESAAKKQFGEFHRVMDRPRFKKSGS